MVLGRGYNIGVAHFGRAFILLLLLLLLQRHVLIAAGYIAAEQADLYHTMCNSVCRSVS